MTSQAEEKVVANDTEEDKEEEEVQDNPDELTSQQKLFYFARRGDVEGIKEIAKAVDINGIDDVGSKASKYVTKNTALHYAVESGSLPCVKVLYNLEATLEVKNKLESTPLHVAASLGYTEIVQFLIEMKANIEAKNIVSNTPLHCAVYGGHTDTVEYILSQLDEPRDALLEPNGVGMGPAKYTVHEDMKQLLRGYFPKRENTNNDSNDNKENINQNEIEEEAPTYEPDANANEDEP